MSETQPLVVNVSELPAGELGARSLLWWGVLGMLATEAIVFVLIAITYFFLRAHVDLWPPPPVAPPDLALSGLGVAVLLASLWPMHRAEQATHAGDRRGTIRWLSLGNAMAAAFLALRVVEWTQLPFRWDSHAYGSIVWVALAFHTLHLGTELVESLVAEAHILAGKFGDAQRLAVTSSGAYWAFVVAMWPPLWAILYLGPRLP